MKRQAKTREWHQRHINDFYVQQATAQGWRSRAAFKLMQIDDRDRLLRPGQVVVDLGCAPGGWCQVAANRMKGQGRIVGIDLLEMTGINGVHFIQGDFTEEVALTELESALEGRQVNLVLSDMAPNISGVIDADQAKVYALAELALDFAVNHLAPEGSLLIKVFQGAGFEAYIKALRGAFKKVATRNPDASRDRSRECYLLASGLK